jgi:hypothetical protein
LPDTHIEEAFEVWWPKLETQLKSLPTENANAKAHRPDRELLEEILGLVRNQLRQSERVTSVVSAPIRPPIRGALARQIRMAAIKEAAESELKAGGHPAAGIEQVDDRRALVTIKNDTYLIDVPENLPSDAIAIHVAAEVKKILRHRATHDLSS